MLVSNCTCVDWTALAGSALFRYSHRAENEAIMISLIQVRSGAVERGSAAAGMRRWANAWRGSLLITLVVLATGGSAAPAAEPVAPLPGNRFLILVETSRPMQRRAEAVVETARELLASGMKGQLRPGDTVGVWTYNQTVHTGRLPLQHAKADNHQEIADRTAAFLKDQKFEKNPSLKELMPMLVQVVADSPFITMVFISSGENPMYGTPYDQAINSMYDEWRAKQAKASKPFVTILRAKAGKLTDFAVHPVPFSVDLPPLPAELVATSPPPAPKPAPRANKPLIVSGRKPAPAPSPAAVAEPSPVPREEGPEAAQAKSEDGTEIGVRVVRRPAITASPTEKTARASEPVDATVAVPTADDVPSSTGSVHSQAPPLERAAPATPNSPPPTDPAPTRQPVAEAPSTSPITDVVPAKAPVTPLREEPAAAASTQPERNAVPASEPALAPQSSFPGPSTSTVRIAARPPAPGPASALAGTPAPGGSQPEPESDASIQVVRAREKTGAAALAAELGKVAALPELPVAMAAVPQPASRSSQILMGTGFGCAALAALGLLYLGVCRRKRPLPRTSIVTRSLQRHTLG